MHDLQKPLKVNTTTNSIPSCWTITNTTPTLKITSTPTTSRKERTEFAETLRFHDHRRSPFPPPWKPPIWRIKTPNPPQTNSHLTLDRNQMSSAAAVCPCTKQCCITNGCLKPGPDSPTKVASVYTPDASKVNVIESTSQPINITSSIHVNFNGLLVWASNKQSHRLFIKRTPRIRMP